MVLRVYNPSAQSRAVSMEMMNSRPFLMNLRPVWATYVTMFQRTKKEKENLKENKQNLKTQRITRKEVIF